MKILLVSLALISAAALTFQNCAKNSFTSSSNLASEEKNPDVDASGFCSGIQPADLDYRACTDGSLKAVQKFNVTCDNGSWVVENDGPIDYKECPNSCVGAAPTYSNEATNCPVPNASQLLAHKKFKATCDSTYKWVKTDDGTDSSQCPIACAGSLSADESCSTINSDLNGTITNYYNVSCGTNGTWTRTPATSGANYQCACTDTNKTFNSTSKNCSAATPTASVFALKLTSSAVSFDPANNGFLVEQPTLYGTTFGKANSINLVVQNTGNTACTISPSTIASNYSDSNVVDFSAVFSIDAASLNKVIAVGASETIVVNSLVSMKKFYDINGTSHSGLLGTLQFRCNEDSSKTSRLGVGFTNTISLDATAQKNRGCVAIPSSSTLLSENESSPKYSIDNPLYVLDGKSIQHVTNVVGTNQNHIALSKSGQYSNIALGVVNGASSVPSNVFFEGSSSDYQVVRNNTDNTIFIDHKICGRTYAFSPSRQGSGLLINFLDGNVYISFGRDTDGTTNWQFYPISPVDGRIPINTTTAIKLANTFPAGTAGPLAHGKYFGWK